MNVWQDLVGQEHVVQQLSAAATDASLVPPGNSMTHAWLVTGPPGSGRSTAAIAFAAALVCPSLGCGQCEDCRLTLAGAHPDVEIIRPEGISYKTEDARALVSRASIAPSKSRWHVIVVEDADRLTETANNVLLKAIEEPPPRAVWLLCTPSSEDVLPTIRSRCRQVKLITPAVEQVAEYLQRNGDVDETTAQFAASASQGHVGRAKALARDEHARARRRQVLGVPAQLTDLDACLRAANELVETARADASSITDPLDEKEQQDLLLAWGEGAQGRGLRSGARGVKGAQKELETRQKSRRTRTERDQLDRALVDLLGFYRDVLAVQFARDGASPQRALINAEFVARVDEIAANSTPTETMLRIDAIDRARLALAANVAPLLAMEALTIDLRRPSLRQEMNA